MTSCVRADWNKKVAPTHLETACYNLTFRRLILGIFIISPQEMGKLEVTNLNRFFRKTTKFLDQYLAQEVNTT